jgi:hypothetical protein
LNIIEHDSDLQILGAFYKNLSIHLVGSLNADKLEKANAKQSRI